VSRAILLTPEREVLLMRICESTTGWTAWITPGGGAKPGEGPDHALRRELFEETGRTDFGPATPVWLRDHSATWEGRAFRQVETFHLVPTERFEPTFEHQPEAVENRAFRGFRWWTIDGIEASDETFVPLDLGALLRDLAENGPPADPITVGV
jgi:8-oxo-dGTP pyrophosphatase MutT (NUDIX family)